MADPRYVRVQFRDQAGNTCSTGIETDDWERDRRWLQLLEALASMVGVRAEWWTPEWPPEKKKEPHPHG